MGREKDWGDIPLLVIVLLILLGASFAAVHFDDVLFPAQTPDRGGYELALAQKAVQQYPYDALARLTLGWAHYRRGDYMDAVEVLEKALEFEPDNQEIYYLLGLVYMELGQLSVAEEMLLVSLELARFPEHLYFALGDLYLLQEDYETAIEYFEKALVRMPNAPDVFIRMAQAYESRGMYSEAATARDRAALFTPEK